MKAKMKALLKNRTVISFLSSYKAISGSIIVLFFLIMSLIGAITTPYDPNKTDWSMILQAASFAHPFGTDELGRDVFSRILSGASISLMAGVISVFIAFCVGVTFGIISGYFGGWLDMVISRLNEVLLALPFLILAISLASFLGPSLENAMLAIGISAAPKFIRLTRGQAQFVASEDYVMSAKLMGASHFRIMIKHILPNIMPTIIIHSTLLIASAIIAESSLSFLGLGQQPPNPSWGSMLSTSKNYINESLMLGIIPGLLIFIVVLGFNLLGDGLRDVLDPKAQK